MYFVVLLDILRSCDCCFVRYKEFILNVEMLNFKENNYLILVISFVFVDYNMFFMIL